MAYPHLGILSTMIADYIKGKEYLEKALTLSVDMDDRAGEATNYGNLGALFKSLGDYVMAKEYHKKALGIKIKIGDKQGEATDFNKLGSCAGLAW